MLRNLGVLKKLKAFTDFDFNFGHAGFELPELEVKAYRQLYLSRFVEVRRFLAFFYARYTLDDTGVNSLCKNYQGYCLHPI